MARPMLLLPLILILSATGHTVGHSVEISEMLGSSSLQSVQTQDDQLQYLADAPNDEGDDEDDDDGVDETDETESRTRTGEHETRTPDDDGYSEADLDEPGAMDEPSKEPTKDAWAGKRSAEPIQYPILPSNPIRIVLVRPFCCAQRHLGEPV